MGYYRTRLTHTLEVSQNADDRLGARMNESGWKSHCAGPDLGAYAFWDTGERVLNVRGGFAHYEQSVRVVEVLEKEGPGAEPDLGDETASAKPWNGGPSPTLEGKIVRFSDKIAYINHDIDDAIGRDPAGRRTFLPSTGRFWAIPPGTPEHADPRYDLEQ